MSSRRWLLVLGVLSLAVIVGLLAVTAFDASPPPATLSATEALVATGNALATAHATDIAAIQLTAIACSAAGDC